MEQQEIESRLKETYSGARSGKTDQYAFKLWEPIPGESLRTAARIMDLKTGEEITMPMTGRLADMAGNTPGFGRDGWLSPSRTAQPGGPVTTVQDYDSLFRDGFTRDLTQRASVAGDDITAAPKGKSPHAGLEANDLQPGQILLYSRADAPDLLRTGVLMHNQDTERGGHRLDVLNDQGLRERLYIGSDVSAGDHNRMGVLAGIAEKTPEPVFVSGIDAQGRLTPDATEALSYGVFKHDAEGNASAVGQALNREMAEKLHESVQQGMLPSPVEAQKTVTSLAALRDMLDLPPLAPEVAAKPEPEKPEIPVPNGPQPFPGQQQQQVVHHHHTLMSSLLMAAMSAGQSVKRALFGPDPLELQHRAHAHADLAQTHLDAIERHPAIQAYRELEKLPNATDRIKAMYADNVLRNNPDLEPRFRAAGRHMEQAANASAAWTLKTKMSDPVLMEKTEKLQTTLGKIPAIGGLSSGLGAALKSLFSVGRAPEAAPRMKI